MKQSSAMTMMSLSGRRYSPSALVEISQSTTAIRIRVSWLATINAWQQERWNRCLDYRSENKWCDWVYRVVLNVVFKFNDLFTVRSASQIMARSFCNPVYIYNVYGQCTFDSQTIGGSVRRPQISYMPRASSHPPTTVVPFVRDQSNIVFQKEALETVNSHGPTSYPASLHSSSIRACWTPRRILESALTLPSHPMTVDCDQVPECSSHARCMRWMMILTVLEWTAIMTCWNFLSTSCVHHLIRLANIVRSMCASLTWMDSTAAVVWILVRRLRRGIFFPSTKSRLWMNRTRPISSSWVAIIVTTNTPFIFQCTTCSSMHITVFWSSFVNLWEKSHAQKSAYSCPGRYKSYTYPGKCSR